MSIVLLTAFALLSPAFAGSSDDEITWDDDSSSAAMIRGAAPKGPTASDDEPDGDDEPDDEVDDVPNVVKRDPGATSEPVIIAPKPGDDEFVFEEPPPVPVAVVAPVLPGPIALEVAGKEPFADNYPAAIVAVDRDDVVVELPVLVAKSRAGAVPFVIIAQFYAGTQKVGEVRQSFDAASLAEFGPTFAFLKVVAPVVDGKGELKVIVSKAKADGTAPTALFTRAVPYTLK